MGFSAGGVWTELAREAVASLRSQGRRSLLALLGVMIGSASIVALMSFAHIARTEVMSRFKAVGVDTVQISPDTGGENWLEPALIHAVMASDPRVAVTAPLAVSRATVRIGDAATSASVAAISPEALDMLKLGVSQGRDLTQIDGCNGAAVIGARTARETRARPGDQAFIGGYGYQVVGILPVVAPQALNPVSPDETVFIGLGCARRVMTREGFSHALVRVQPDIDPSEWGAALQKQMQSRGQPVKTVTPREMIEAMKSQMNLMSAILIAIGSVSLLVGGVGVMNVMLMSVMERRREIGLRAAIGATPSEIVFIFIVEAVALSLGGGFLGALAGVGMTTLGCLVLPISFAFDPSVMLWGTGIAGAVGLVFGIHPAVSAARILPVEALRAD
ncbi:MULTISPECIES: ABC transporter permease [unclassified Brevundimonas]|uniref:ABC transporter permease n=1 Tax=unclassified Brevundimonas TaxID=2622653 RepID=UPI0025B8BF7C|nr:MULTISPECIES: ABC transporter permease [unclassified Brevundimonas]